MSNQLTNKDFWKKRWKNYTPKMTKNQQFFEKYIPRIYLEKIEVS